MEINKCYNERAEDLLRRTPDDFIDLTVTSPPYDCYSEDTEILTQNGWKLIKDTKTGEKVMTLNPKTKNIYFEEIIKTYQYDYEGDLINFKNQSIDLLVTPNHKMYVEYRGGLPTRERKVFVKRENLKTSFLKNACDVKICDLLRLKHFKYKGAKNEYFLLPEIECLYNKQFLKFDEIKINMHIWCKFFGLYLAEGCSRGTKGGKKISYNVSIKQKDGINNQYIEDLFNKLPFKYNIHTEKQRKIRNYNISNKQLHHYLFQFGDSFQKFVPRNILDLDSEYLQSFLEGYLLGDGTKSKTISMVGKYSCVKSFSNQLRRDLLEISIKIGLCAREDSKRKYVIFPDSDYTKLGEFKKLTHYKGKVVCVEVKKDNIVYVKRNGKCVFSGNSLRTYKGYSLDLDVVIKELYRATKKGGVCVWVIADQVKKNSETGTSFRQALKFIEHGWKLHDTMIYKKLNPTPNAGTRYQQSFEYMFVFSKGKPKTTNIELRDRRNKCNDKRTFRRKKFSRDTNGDFNTNDYHFKERVPKENIWEYYVGGGNSSKDKIAFKHPAIFPEELAKDHILSWTNEGDLVADIMAGSGTTLKMARLNKRNYLGGEISKEYCYICDERMEKYKTT